MSATPGVIVSSRFQLPGSQKFKRYVAYMDREAAIKNDKDKENNYAGYNDYMGNEEKTTGIFTSLLDHPSKEQINELKELFNKAQQNGSIMWQDVISFDNKFLEKYGILNATGKLNEKRMRDVTRSAVDTMLQKEGLKDTAVWSGSIHYNTDNIHIHVATVEPIPTRERGKRKQKSINAMKSKVANKLLDRGLERENMNSLIRNRMAGNPKQFSLSKDKQVRNLFSEIMTELPEDRRYWQYNYEKLSHVRPKIDQLSKRYIELYHKDDFALLNKKLDKEVTYMKEAFGEESNYEKYKENKIKDLYTRLGNAALKEMRQVSKQNEQVTIQHARSINHNEKGKYARRKLDTVFALKKMNKYMDKSYESWKNQLDYERIHNLDREKNESESEQQ